MTASFVRSAPAPIGGLVGLVVLQVAVTAAPLALLPFLGLAIGEMTEAPAFWTASALAAPAVTTLAMTPIWARFARLVPLWALIVWAVVLSALSCGLIAIATTPATLVIARLIQGAAGSGIVLALAFRAGGRSFAFMQQAVSVGCLIGPVLGGIAFGRSLFSLLMVGCAGLILAAGLTSAIAFRQELVESHHEPRAGSGWLHSLPLLCAGMCGSAGAFAFVSFFPVWASGHDPALYTPSFLGLLHSLSWLIAILVLPLWARAIDVSSPLRILGLSLVGCTLAFAAVPLSAGLAGIVALRLVQGAFFAGQTPALLTAAEAAGPSRVTATAHARASLTIGQLVGPFIAGLAVAPFGPGAALLAAAGLSLLGLVSLGLTSTSLLHTIWNRNR